MEKIKLLILKGFGLSLELESYGDIQARSNVFYGRDGAQEYIIKLEGINSLDSILDGIHIASQLRGAKHLSSSYFITNLAGKFYAVFEDKVLTVQLKEKLMALHHENKSSIVKIGEGVGEFHKLINTLKLRNKRSSDFYNDFMGNDVHKAQSPERLVKIKNFYNKAPDYSKLTQGIIHNDLNSNNVFMSKEKYFFIDFESILFGPFISDIAVLGLHLWDYKKGKQNYQDTIACLLQGYQNHIKLNGYDILHILTFSLRYLYSDENWYIYWAQNGNPEALQFIPEVLEKQEILQG